MRTSLLALFALTACIDADVDEATLSETSSAISVAGGAAWGTLGQSGEMLELGPTSQQTCFLSGATGDFYGWSAGAPQYVPASAEVLPSNGKWWLKTTSGKGSGVMAHAVCVNIPYGGAAKELVWSDNKPSATLPAPANRRCFLRRVWSTRGLDGFIYGIYGMTNITLSKVTIAGNHEWRLGGYVHDHVGTGGWAGATATCIDFPLTEEWTHVVAGPASGKTTTITAAHTPGTACGLTQVRGNWANPSPSAFGWLDGVNARGDGDPWRIEATNGKRATVNCVK